ncbi:hypothetical protein [Microbispora sp. KK1-11]|uniref:hypothetical protein n=1 Tax=Microbispora sp. KK1-11 TaxID=2053005 RepID=UPI00115C01D6|nr:hypothetical protein [Microbispora sp. KK1-11]TQS29628.1 hypothetical protein FLW16_08345 [Microbispora sp. KK1-11]
MGIVGKASAISAGALAITLAGGLPLAASPAQALDCTSGGGLVSGITGGVCSLVDGVGRLADGVTDVADKATGGATEPVTKAVDDTLKTTTGAAGTAVNDVGKAVDKAGRTLTGAADTAAGAASGSAGDAGGAVSGATGAVGGATGVVSGATGALTGGESGAAHSPAPSIQKLTDGLTRAVQDTCLPLVAGEGCASDENRESGEDGRSAGKTRPAGKKATRPKASMTPEGTLSPEPYRPRLVAALDDTPETGRAAKVDPDEDGVIPLLWPGQKMPELPELQGAPAGARARAHRSYDAAGTALTAVLLLSALLATRVVSARRARAGQQEPHESIPFEGGLRLPGKAGRHRLA